MNLDIPEPLRSVLQHRFPVMTPERGEVFRRQFALAILHRTITLEQYRALTGDDLFPTREALDAWFREA